ncbi:hypothetical protein [Dyadobacter diqingensis]|nr:hypothetical protein [Dyadobacter diqingensis]
MAVKRFSKFVTINLSRLQKVKETPVLIENGQMKVGGLGNYF